MTKNNFEYIKTKEYATLKYKEAEAALQEGLVYFRRNDMETAIECCHQALTYMKGMHEAHINLAYCYHLIGQPEKGWEEFEYRLFFYPELIDYMGRFRSEKKWGGFTSLSGTKVMVYGEQGYGDVIHMTRYLRQLKEMQCTLLLCCPRPLVRLMSNYWWLDKVYATEDIVESGTPEYDWHIPSFSLPHLLRSYNPKFEPYIEIRKRFGLGHTNHFRVGVAWKGSKYHADDDRRSCELSFFEALTDIPNLNLVSLCPERIESNILDLSDALIDFERTAEIINDLDLVISVDTAVLHLAGAMGKEAWGLLPFTPDFRWGLYSTKTQWYPSMTLFRQSTAGDWQELFKRVRKALENKVVEWQEI